MLFNSVTFLVFFIVVTTLYFVLPFRLRWLLLLLASCIFYMAFIPIYIVILFTTITVDYFAGIMIEREVGGRKRAYLTISLFVTISILFVFKYFNFFNANIAAIAERLHWNYGLTSLKLILPIGLSFHTFQSMSYIIEVYRGKQKVEKNFGIYALYVMFYPQLVAGPIERPQNLLHQFYETHLFDFRRVADGLKLMLWGLFKKVVIADRLSMLVNQVYNHPRDYSGFPLLLATVFFAFQIYCDFSGYSDIAIGSAQVMGFKLMDNFNRPYFSKSISEFWKRWHISLSTWFRDYFYISLGGNRVAKPRWYLNLFLTFLISGLWHGANWTYVAWGALNGAYLVFSIWTQKYRDSLSAVVGLSSRPILQKYFRLIVTFSLVCFSWIFFRANSIADATYVAAHIFSGLGAIVNNLVNQNFYEAAYRLSLQGLGLSPSDMLIAFVSIAFLVAVQAVQRRGNLWRMLLERPTWLRFSLYYCLILSIFCFGVFAKSKFIYFQF